MVMLNEEKLNSEEELLAKSEVSLILDSYNDIFSSFDPRPYSERALSVDLLDEAKRATREVKPGFFELRFLLPVAKRRIEKENMIKKRLKDHVKKHRELLEKEHKSVIKQGFYFLIFGLIFMFGAAFILFYYHSMLNLWKEFLVVLLEPGGWFLLWEGLDLVIFKSKETKPDLEFYRKMSNVEIIFSHY